MKAPAGFARLARSPATLAALGLLSVGFLAANVPAATARAAPTTRAPRAPGGPPLLAPGAGLGATIEEAAAPAAPQSDVLAGNGLDSPLCRYGLAELSNEQRGNCASARFVVAPYPTADFMFDVNIDTGVARWSNDAAALVQNLTQLGWMALVSATHGLIAMLEWSYSLGSATRGLMVAAAARLRAAGAGFTQPLLALGLSIAAALAVYHGLLRRRISTVGETLMTVTLIVAGLWLIVDPSGTVGAVERWSDEAGAGTLAVVAAGAPERPARTLAGALSEVFDATVSAPWCYMEFGAVQWCESPALLDGRLRAAALRIAAKLQSSSARPGAALLRAAQSNGQLFLALPAEKPQRNSVKTNGTLLNVLCGGAGSVQECRGPTAAQAEFRGPNGTYARVIGLLLIWMGALGMLLLFGFLTARLLLSGITTVGYLMLAPAAALVPVMGSGGHAAFRRWGMRLLAAAVSKLTYSFLLGVVLALTSLLLGLRALGWWAQWLLLSAFWWSAFLKRHHALQALAGGRGQVLAPRRPLAWPVRAPRALAYAAARRVVPRPSAPYDRRERPRLPLAAMERAGEPAPALPASLPVPKEPARPAAEPPPASEGSPPASPPPGERWRSSAPYRSPLAEDIHALADEWEPGGGRTKGRR